LLAMLAAAFLIVAARRLISGTLDRRVALIGGGIVAATSLLAWANRWEAIAIGYSTAEPWKTQLALTMLGWLAGAAVKGLALGALTGAGAAVAQGWTKPSAADWRASLWLAAIALGVVSASSEFGTRDLPEWPDMKGLDGVVPWLGAFEESLGFFTSAGIVVLVFDMLQNYSERWTRRRGLLGGIIVAGCICVTLTMSRTFAGGVAAGAALGLGLLGAYAGVFRLLPHLLVPTLALTAGGAWIGRLLEDGHPHAASGAIVGLASLAAGNLLWRRFARPGG